MRRRPLCAVFLFLILVLIICRTAGLPLPGSPVFPEKIRLRTEEEPVSLTGFLHNRQEKNSSTSYFLSDSEIDSVSLHNVSLYFSKTTPAFPAGTRITVTGNLEWYENAANPGGFDAAEYYAAEDCFSRMYVETYSVRAIPAFSPEEEICGLREETDRNLHLLMEKNAADVLSAMLLGEKNGLSEEIRLDYSAAGLGHVLAISGFHVHLFGMALYRMLMRLRCRTATASAAVMVFLVFYCMFTGGSSSTIRAAVMFGTALLARSLLRSYDPYSALSLAGCLILAFRPAMLFRAGFQLSFAAALAISAVYPAMMKAAQADAGKTSIKHRIRFWMKSSVLLWLSVNLFTFPLILYHFCEYPLYSLLSNLFLMPLMGILMVSGAVGAALSFLFPAAAQPVLAFSQQLLQMVSSAGEQIRKLPFSQIITGKPGIVQLAAAAAGLGLVLFLTARHVHLRFRFLPALLIFLCVLRLPQGFSITVLDVGQGDCIVLRTERDSVFLIDAGSTSQNEVGRYVLIPYLKAEGITRISGIFLTHADRDHENGIEELLEKRLSGRTSIQVDRLILPYWMRSEEKAAPLLHLAEEAGVPVYYARRGDQLKDGETEVKVLSPQSGDGLTGNDGSLVLLVRYRMLDALLTGDLEKEGEERLLPYLGDVDMLKVAHHGSSESTGSAFLQRTSPEVCLISAPVHSIYGHPHKETIDRIEECGADWYQTGLTGAVRVTTEEGRMVVRCFRSGQNKKPP